MSRRTTRTEQFAKLESFVIRLAGLMLLIFTLIKILIAEAPRF